MHQPHHEPDRGTPRHATARERELEIELARVQAELEAATGGDPATATSRFLEMAAATVDLAVTDARREADELASELSADAERRRDEAVRIATDAEMTAERLADEAERAEASAAAARMAASASQAEADTARTTAQEIAANARRELEAARAEAKAITEDAEADADAVRVRAESDATSLVLDERNRLNEELATLTDVRNNLETERDALEDYHEELRRRVQDLAESMVAFMTTEAPIVPLAALDEKIPEELEPATSADPSVGVPETEAASPFARPAEPDQSSVPHAPTPAAPTPTPAAPVTAPDPAPAPAEQVVVEQPAPVEQPTGGYPLAGEFDPAEEVASGDIAAEAQTDGDNVFNKLRSSEPASEPAPADQAEPAESAQPGTPFSDLFAAATEEELEPGPLGSLFSEHGARLIEQTAPNQLADALGDPDTEADERFKDFLQGDDAEDPSREWLLRPENT